jgi:DNA-binding CsgD family transcriptional regulator
MVAPIGTGIAGRGAVLFVSDPVEPVQLSMETICNLYGLTPAEGRLALGLTNGRTMDSLAEEWNVSMHTVRSQLRQIFRKTETSRQSELVKLILTGPAALKARSII